MKGLTYNQVNKYSLAENTFMRINKYNLEVQIARINGNTTASYYVFKEGEYMLYKQGQFLLIQNDPTNASSYQAVTKF